MSTLNGSHHRMPPNWMLEVGKQTNEFFESRDHTGQRKLKSIEQYSREHNTQEKPSRRYFRGKLLPEIIFGYDRDKDLSSQDYTTSSSL